MGNQCFHKGRNVQAIEDLRRESERSYRQLVARLEAGESPAQSEVLSAIVPLGKSLADLAADVALVGERKALLNTIEAGETAEVRTEEISVRTAEIRAERERLGHEFTAADKVLEDKAADLHTEFMQTVRETRAAGVRAKQRLAETAAAGCADPRAPENFALDRAA